MIRVTDAALASRLSRVYEALSAARRRRDLRDQARALTEIAWIEMVVARQFEARAVRASLSPRRRRSCQTWARHWRHWMEAHVEEAASLGFIAAAVEPHAPPEWWAQG